jgi:hypothetical protein
MEVNVKYAPKTTLTNHNLKKLIELAGSVSYGSVTLVIQDGKAIQIEKREKVRL